MLRAARVFGVGAAGLCAAAVATGILMASPASARAVASLSVSPGNGPVGTPVSATFMVQGGAGGTCSGGAVSFVFDSTPIGTAGLNQASCSASIAFQVPGGAAAGGHKVRGTLTGGTSAASASSTFTVDGGASSPPPTSNNPPPSSSNPPPSSSSITTLSNSASPTAYRSYFNTLTPTVPWTPPPFVPQPPPDTTGPCDTSGAHATSSSSGFLVVQAYAAGQHPNPAPGSPLVNEPSAGHLPITSVGPAAMTPPRLGTVPYQSLELVEPVDPAISSKLRLAAAAGEPFGCLEVEEFGAPGSGYGYLVYALKGALVISSQELNPDPPTPTGTPTPAKPGASKAAKAAPTTAPQPKFERIVLGYSSISWEYQEAAGGALAPIHRGAGTIIPAPPAGSLSYSNLVFAFGGLVAATVALLFAYHSRRREMARRGRRRMPGTTSHA